MDCGRVQATGALVGAPAWRSGTGALRRAREHGVDVGLHLDLTAYPQTGGLHGLRALIVQSCLGRLDHARLRAEMAAQLDAFEAGLGQPPAFIDGHEHVHQLPTVRDALIEVVTARYPARRPWLRSSRARLSAARVAGPTALLKAAVIGALGASALARAASAHGLRQNRSLLGVYGFAGDAAHYLGLLRGWLLAAHDGDLLMCHPALPAPARGDPDAIAQARRVEYEVLAGPAFGQLVQATGVRLQPLSRTLADGSA